MLMVLRNFARLHVFAMLALCVLLCGCKWGQKDSQPSIEFDKVPPTGQGGPVPLIPISGHVIRSLPGKKIVLFAKDVNGVWWVQPQAIQPLIAIKADSSWTTPTHLGTEYAALLVDAGYRPPATARTLPAQGGKILAVATVKGIGPLVVAVPKTLQFSGYDWKAVNATNERNGMPNTYIPENASVDSNGALHMRIVQKDNSTTCSQVILQHSFGYGTYSFSIEDISHFAPAAVLTLFTWDDLGAEQNHREMDIEISRWGDPAAQNAQFVVQPYYVPENVARFMAPSGAMTFSFRWEPAKVSFQAMRKSDNASRRDLVATHVFTAGIPSAGGETVSMNFCAFGFSKVPLEENAEVVIDKFQYLP